MKKPLFLILYTLLSTIGFGQIQTGLVREINSGKKPVGGVQVIFNGAVPTVSDDNGIFRLAFSGKRPGGVIFLNEVRKVGYELVNGKDLEVLKLSNTDNLGEDIIVAKKGVIDAVKKEYYAVSDKALLASFNKEKKALQIKLAKAQLSQKDYEQQLTDLQEHFDRQKKSLEELAEKFAKVNFDDIDSLYRTALELFKSGDIDGAIKKLEEGNLPKRADAIADAETKIVRSKKEVIRSIRLQSDLYSLKFRLKDTELLVDKLLLIDSTDLDILWNSLGIYILRHQYEKTLYFSLKIIYHQKVEEWQTASVYTSIGDAYVKTGNFNKALNSYLKTLFIYEKLAKKEANSIFLRENIALTFSILGETESEQNNFQQAMEYYKKGYEIEKKIYEHQPSNVEHKHQLAIFLSKFGEIETALGGFEQALIYYEQFNRLENELHNLIPNNVAYTHGLAISFTKLGQIQGELGNWQQALKHYEQYNILSKQLHESYPDILEFKNGLAISFLKLGETRFVLGDFNLALKNCVLSNNLEKELHDAFPNNVNFTKALAISFERLGQIQIMLGNPEQALRDYEQSNNLKKQLCDKFPGNMAYKNSLSKSFLLLGDVQISLRNLPIALQYYEHGLTLGHQLREAYPDNAEFKNDLAIFFSKLGTAQASLNNLQQTLQYYKQFNDLEKQLHKDHPDNRKFKSNLASSYFCLGVFYQYGENDKQKAKLNFEEALILLKELVESFPLKSDYKKEFNNVKKNIDSL